LVNFRRGKGCHIGGRVRGSLPLHRDLGVETGGAG
jgi:hypothetical protein